MRLIRLYDYLVGVTVLFSLRLLLACYIVYDWGVYFTVFDLLVGCYWFLVSVWCLLLVYVGVILVVSCYLILGLRIAYCCDCCYLTFWLVVAWLVFLFLVVYCWWVCVLLCFVFCEGDSWLFGWHLFTLFTVWLDLLFTLCCCECFVGWIVGLLVCFVALNLILYVFVWVVALFVVFDCLLVSGFHAFACLILLWGKICCLITLMYVACFV